ncbi:MAG TPA: ASPIC/UnbV domain-containing protein [Gemmataceae bacterium]|nr:ASPIC/UnbV domain-containing protein [Gemmataceae bacterium]
MSQPSDRTAKVKAPGKVDASLGEFWVETPWDIFKQGHNLSCFERKRAFLNVPGQVRGRDFVDISFVSGADNDSDGRCVVAGDFRNNGQLDLVVRQVGGGPIILYENNFPKRHYLKVTLRGKPRSQGLSSNRQGVGARLVAVVNGQQLVREMFPANSYRSEMPNIVHFGLADASRVDRLTIRWPSGLEQTLTNLPGDRHIVVTEGVDKVETVNPGQTIAP